VKLSIIIKRVVSRTEFLNLDRVLRNPLGRGGGVCENITVTRGDSRSSRDSTVCIQGCLGRGTPVVFRGGGLSELGTGAALKDEKRGEKHLKDQRDGPIGKMPASLLL